MKVGWMLISLAAVAYLLPTIVSRVGCVEQVPSVRTNEVDQQDCLVGGGREWLPGIELTHAADVYDSLDSVAQRLAAEVVAHLLSDASYDRPIMIGVRFVGDILDANQQSIVKASFERGLRSAGSEYSAFNDNRLQVFTDQAAPTQAMQLSIRLDNEFSVHNEKEVKSLVIQANLRTPDASVSLSPMQLVSKPWVQSWNAFRSRHSQDNYWQYRGNSMQEAEMALADQLAHQLVGQQSRRRWLWNRSSLSVPSATRLILRELDHCGLIVDRFSQTFQLRLADGTQVPAISRCALLVDQNPQRLARLSSILTSAARHQSRDHWVRSCMLGATVLVLCVAYVGLNSLTQGYYVWHLRGICTAIAVIVSQIIV